MEEPNKYFKMPGKEIPELISVPKPSSNKNMYFVGGVALIALVAFIATFLPKKGNPTPTLSPTPTMSSSPVVSPTSSVTDIYSVPGVVKRTELNPEILDDVLDTYDNDSRQPEELEKVEKYPLMNVLHYLSSHTEEEVQANLTNLGNTFHRYISFEDMMTDPRMVRGATVHVEGKIRLYGYTEFEMSFQVESGIRGIWYGNLFDRDNMQFAFRLLQGGEKFKENDIISFYGVFLKRMWFRNKMGVDEGKMKYSIMPIVYAKQAYFVKNPAWNFPKIETIISFAAAFLLILLFGFVLSREIRNPGRRRKPPQKVTKGQGDNEQHLDKPTTSDQSN